MEVSILLFKRKVKLRNRLFDPKEYLPEGEIHSLIQIFYLSLMAACFICILYIFIFRGKDLHYFAALDVGLSLFITLTADKSTKLRKIASVLIVPYSSLTFLLFNFSTMCILDLIQIPALIYFIHYYYGRFKEYTEQNSLGIATILLFIIIFLSSLNTMVVEDKNPLDALVMTSNAFTSNGYAVLGQSITGKINSLILVWSGFILSGVGSATLTLTLLTNHYNNKIKRMEKLLKDNNKKLEPLEKLIKKQNNK